MSLAEPEPIPCLDVAVVEQLSALGQQLGSNVLTEIVATYRSAATASVAALQAAATAGDADALRRSAHSLKGASLQIGAQRVGALARRLEEAGHTGLLAGTAGLVALLERELSIALVELGKYADPR